MNEIKVMECFGGIGALTQAFKRTGIPHKVVEYVEIDKYAVASYNAINGTSYEPQDICTWDKDIDVDLIMHGSPCQDFSLAGKQAGGDEGSGTRSSLMYETIRIVEKLKPTYVIWENVKNILSKKHRHNFDAYLEKMEHLGYTNYYQVLNAKDYGIPQNRERVFTISILNKTNCSEELTKLLEMFENTEDEDFLKKGKIKYEIFDKYGVDKKCVKCGNQLLISDLPEYKYLCFECDENMYEFEAIDFKFPEKKTLEKYMIDYLENKVDDKYNVGEKRLEIIKNNLGNVFEDNFVIGSSQKNAFVGDESICPTLTTAMANGGGQVPMIKYIFPPKQELKLKLKDMLEDEVDEKYYLSNKMVGYISASGTANFRNPDSKINLDIARPLTTDQNKRAGTTNYLSDDLPDNYDLSILIKNNTKQGYLEAHEGDGVNICGRMEHQRGNVQKDSIQTLTTCGNDRGVVVSE